MVRSAHSAYYSEATIGTFSFMFNTYQCITMRLWLGHFPQCSVMQFIPSTQFSWTTVEGLLGYAQENPISRPTWQWKCDRSLWHLIRSSFHTYTNALSCISVRVRLGHCHRCSVLNTQYWINILFISVFKEISGHCQDWGNYSTMTINGWPEDSQEDSYYDGAWMVGSRAKALKPWEWMGGRITCRKTLSMTIY